MNMEAEMEEKIVFPMSDEEKKASSNLMYEKSACRFRQLRKPERPY